MHATDRQLLQQSQAGDAHAFGRLVERHQATVQRVAFRATGDAALSEDLTQDAFVTAWRQLGDLRQPSRFTSWVCGIARNLARYSQRHHRRHAPDACVGAGIDRIALDRELAELACSNPSPLDDAIASQRHDLLRRALGRIPSSYRDPLLLFYREQQSVEQVAVRLDLSVSTAKQRLSRGRKVLRRSIEQLNAGASGGIAAAVVTAITFLASTDSAAAGLCHAAGAQLATQSTTSAASSATQATSGLSSWQALWTGKPLWLSLSGAGAASAAMILALVTAATPLTPVESPSPRSESRLFSSPAIQDLTVVPPAPDHPEQSTHITRPSVEIGPGQIERLPAPASTPAGITRRPAAERPTHPTRRPAAHSVSPRPRSYIALVEPGSIAIRRVSRILASPSLHRDDVAPEYHRDRSRHQPLPIEPPDLRQRILDSDL